MCEYFYKVIRIAQVSSKMNLAILVKHGAVGVPEKDVLFGITDGEFVFDFFFEIVGGVLGFPEAVIEAVVVQQRQKRLFSGDAFPANGQGGFGFDLSLVIRRKYRRGLCV